MQINRLFEIVYLLLNKKTITAGELAERFEVSTRTIYRDIEALSQAGIPVYASRGKGGGVSLMDSFVLKSSLLTVQEQQDILTALQGLAVTNYPAVPKVISKLGAVFQTNVRDWVAVDFSDWSNDQQSTFALLKTAVIGGQAVSFDYFGTNGQSSHRTVEPLQLWFKERNWYLKAHCRERAAMRLFKANRIRNLVMLDDFFQRELPEETEPPMDEKIQASIVEVVLQVDASQSYRVYDEFHENCVEKHPDGSFRITTRLVEDDWVYGYLMSFGDHAQVLEPAHMRRRIQESLAAALARYE